MKTALVSPMAFGIVWLAALSAAAAVGPAALQWTRHIPTGHPDNGAGVSTDGMGNIYMAGEIVDPPSTSILSDAFVSRFDEAGALRWTRTLSGGPDQDSTNSVSADRLGNIFFTGTTLGRLAGMSAGSNDAFVGNYDRDGNLRWLHQFGTAGGDHGRGVTADGLGNAYVTGITLNEGTGPGAGTGDAFLRKYDSAGNLLWSRLVGDEDHEDGFAVAVDRLGNVFLTGVTVSFIPGPGGTTIGDLDVLVSKLNTEGDLQWTRQIFGMSYDDGLDLAADGLGNVYIAGATGSDLAGYHGAGDGFIAKYNAAGDLQWLDQFGSTQFDSAGGISADAAGNIYVTGHSDAQLEGTVVGAGGVFVRKYDPAGNVIWTTQFGSINDHGSGLASDGRGAIYISGSGVFRVHSDPALFKLIDPGFLVPEPSAAAHGAMALLCSAFAKRRRGNCRQVRQQPCKHLH